jgi:hypothetical protein
MLISKNNVNIKFNKICRKNVFKVLILPYIINRMIELNMKHHEILILELNNIV